MLQKIHPPLDLGSGGTSNSDFLCLQAEKNSDLEFREAMSCMCKIRYFLLMQSWHFPVTGLKEGRFSFKKRTGHHVVGGEKSTVTIV